MTHSDLTRLFREHFHSEPDLYSVAPGRVNLIGEHTDYNGGFVFPAAIDRQIYVAATITDGPTELFSEQAGEGKRFDAGSIEIGGSDGWTAYAAGMAWVLREHTGAAVPNIRAVVASTLPMGSGVSSSAAIEMAFGVLWNQVAQLGLDNKTLALLAQRCENLFVGVNCGIMDQMASAMGRDGSAMFLDTRTLAIEYARIPDDLAILVCDTGKPRALTDSAYNERRSQCEVAAGTIGVRELRDANHDDLESHRAEMSEVVYRRARHVVTENDRCLEFREALNAGDRTEIGRLMAASHESLRDDYEVSCLELDAMAESSWAAPGCVGARMTGAGFGGVCIALVDSSRVEAFSERAGTAYFERTGLTGDFIPCRAVQGAHIFGVQDASKNAG